MTKIDPGTADEIRQLAQRPSFQLLVGLVEQGREEFYASFARTLSKRGSKHVAPVDQREVDYLRGFWAGAHYAVVDYPRDAAKQWKRHLEAEESEDQ